MSACQALVSARGAGIVVGEETEGSSGEAGRPVSRYCMLVYAWDDGA